MRYGMIILSFWALSCTINNDKKVEETSSQPYSIKLKDLHGNSIALDSYKEKVVFINFWATWCGPCIKEMPSLGRMENKLKDEPVVFLYASNEAISKIKKFSSKKSWNLNYVNLDMSMESLNIYALPTTFILRNEEVVWKKTGSRVWDTEESISELITIINQ